MGKFLGGRYKHLLRYYECGYEPNLTKGFVLTEPYKQLNEISPRSTEEKLHACFNNKDTPATRNLWWCYRQLEEIFLMQLANVNLQDVQSDTQRISNIKYLFKERFNGINKDLNRLLIT